MKQLLGLLLFLILSTSSKAQEKINYTNEHSNLQKNELLIPNAFTPNGDGVNDIFKIANFENQELLEFRIFNRWGTVLFRTENPKEGWDGTFKNQSQPTGTYGYMIKIAFPEGVVETYKGTVTLIR